MKYILKGQQTQRLIFRKIQQSDYDQWLPFFQDPMTSIHWVEERQTPEHACQ
jgi:[ribosomal protein S5]-alanine N-acetyltransferase